jgi:hypothetical protein
MKLTVSVIAATPCISRKDASRNLALIVWYLVAVALGAASAPRPRPGSAAASSTKPARLVRQDDPGEAGAVPVVPQIVGDGLGLL